MLNRFSIPAGAVMLAVSFLVHAGALPAAESTLQPGDKAPEFSAQDEQGRTWESGDHVGNKIVVVYFYPANFTPGCTRQACAFRDDREVLSEMDVEVVGVSGDTVESHKLFKQAESLNFTLLADPQAEVARKFGVPYSLGERSLQATVDGQQHTVTRGSTIQRYTFVIDTDGKIAAAYQVSDAAGDSQNILQTVKKLQAEN